MKKFLDYRHSPGKNPTPKESYTYGIAIGFCGGLMAMGLAVCPLMPWWNDDERPE